MRKSFLKFSETFIEHKFNFNELNAVIERIWNIKLRMFSILLCKPILHAANNKCLHIKSQGQNTLPENTE